MKIIVDFETLQVSLTGMPDYVQFGSDVLAEKLRDAADEIDKVYNVSFCVPAGPNTKLEK